MRAMVVSEFGMPSQVVKLETEWPEPQPGKGEARIEQFATSLNMIDIGRAAGYGRKLLRLRFGTKLPMVLGNDIYGVVDAVGPGVKSVTKGALVFGAKPPSTAGAYAEKVVAKAEHIVAVPVQHHELAIAGIPYVFHTAWAALVTSGKLVPGKAQGKRVFIQGGAGAVGSQAVQLAKHWGAHVAVSCSARDMEFVRALGADEAFDYATDDFAEHLRNFDLALATANNDEQDKMIAILRRGGDAAYATLHHPTLELVNDHGILRGLFKAVRMRRRLNRTLGRDGRRVEWVLFAPDATALETMAAMLADGTLVPPQLGEVLPLDQLPIAMGRMMMGARGKFIFDIRQ